jgi:hypothetical protein
MILKELDTVFFKEVMLKRRRPAAIRPLGVTGKEPVIPRGWTPSKNQKPWQDRRTLSFRSASGNLAHGFCFLGRTFFREPMKEIRNVQYSFS